MKIRAFNREIDVYFDFEYEGYLEYIEDLINSLDKPFVVSFAGRPEIRLHTNYYGDKYFYGMEDYIFSFANPNTEKYLDKIRDVAIEDEEWTKQRNEGYAETLFHQFTLKDHIIKALHDELITVKNEIEKYLKVLQEEKIKQKTEKDNRESMYIIEKVYKSQMPKGGEDGQDGYYDVDLKSQNGNTIRMVARNVFDFGFYTYPKRLEGSEAIFKKELYSDDELKASDWLYEFSPFTTDVRM